MSAMAIVPALGCSDRRVPVDTNRLSWTLSPDPPRVGPAVLSLSLVDGEARPVRGARLRIEGDMTHPGMRPIAAEGTPRADGGYEARLTFTMAGDWVLLVRADWAEGQLLERAIPVRVGP
jgi:hypothetical protein